MFFTYDQLKDLCGSAIAKQVFSLKYKEDNEALEKQVEELKKELKTYQGKSKHLPVRILDSRGVGAGSEFKVLWDDQSETWEPRGKLDAPNLVKDFQREKKRLYYQHKRAAERKDTFTEREQLFKKYNL